MAEETTAEAPAEETERDTIVLDVLVTTEGGERVPVEIRLRYPAGCGLTAAAAITHDAPEFFGEVADELLRRGDAEAVAQFKRHQLETFEDEGAAADTIARGKQEG